MRVVLAVLLFALAIPVRADVIMVNGTLAGDPMPDGYKFELAVVAIHTDGVVFEVVGKSCSSLTPDDASRGCQRTTINFTPPAGSIVVEGKKAFFKQENKTLYIGDVAGLGNTHWINLRHGAVLEATLKAARIKIDTAVLGGFNREDVFSQLYPH